MMIINYRLQLAVKGKRHGTILLGWCVPHHCTSTAASISSSKRETPAAMHPSSSDCLATVVRSL